MKALINLVANPIYSFTLTIIGFYFFMKYYYVVGTKKFITVVGIGGTILFGWMCTDPNFFAIVTWPDNVPIVILLVLVIYLTWYAIYKATENDKRIAAGLGPIEGTPENKEKVWVWPNLVYTELMAMIVFTALLIVWSIFLKAPLEEPANPTWAPNPAKAPWYFLGLQEMLVYFDPWMAGVVLPVLIIVGLIAMPFIDTNPNGNGYYSFAGRKLAMAGFLFGWLVLWIYLIIVGTFLRGPNWTFYGPFEYWDFHKVVAESNVNLSEFFWIKGLGTAMPGSILIRELPGIIFTGLYYGLPIWIMNKSERGIAMINNMGKVRYYILILLALTMLLLPVKMYLRWMFNLKYLVAMPEFELNL